METLSKNFLARNAKFKAASAAEKRVLIARDVIKQLQIKKYKAIRGEWMSITTEYSKYNILDNSSNNDKQICNLIDDPKNRCKVCAIGSIFSSMIRFKDKIKAKHSASLNFMRLSSNYYRTTIDRVGIKKLFSEKQLQLIEIAYELGDGLWKDRAKVWNNTEFGLFFNEALHKARSFGLKYEKDSDRMIAIMRNIVKNKGLFMP